MNEAVRIPASGLPIVRARQNNWAPWAFGAVALVGALVLYNSLEQARASRLGQSEGAPTVDVAPARPLPDLVIPQRYETVAAQERAFAARPAVRLEPLAPVSVIQRPAVVYRTAPTVAATNLPTSPPPQPPAYQVAPPVTAPMPEFNNPQRSENNRAGSRASAQKLSNPTFTVAQGVLIPAVLETALDSSRAGPARALVSRDVRGFDRERILIPRGSKLIGEYQSDMSVGQKRASVTWTRLIRPDGVTIDLRSPAADGLGRAGIRGKVNNHTMRRVGDALLQTMVGVGSSLTQRAATQPIIIAQSGAQPPSINIGGGDTIQPTLTVAQGSRISVFVSRDLDFSSVEQQP